LPQRSRGAVLKNGKRFDKLRCANLRSRRWYRSGRPACKSDFAARLTGVRRRPYGRSSTASTTN